MVALGAFVAVERHQGVEPAVDDRLSESQRVLDEWDAGSEEREKQVQAILEAWSAEVEVQKQEEKEPNPDVLGAWLAMQAAKEAEAAWEQRKSEYRQKRKKVRVIPDECSYSSDLDVHTWEEVERMEWYCVQDLQRFESDWGLTYYD